MPGRSSGFYDGILSNLLSTVRHEGPSESSSGCFSVRIVLFVCKLQTICLRQRDSTERSYDSVWVMRSEAKRQEFVLYPKRSVQLVVIKLLP